VVGYIGGQGAVTKKAGFFLSLVYVLGLALTYSLLGALSALTGMLFGQMQHSPWTYIVVGNIILLFGLAMLDVFTIPMPSLGMFDEAAHRGGAIGAFLLGLTSGFIAAPCTVPILGVVLTYVAARQNVATGISLLFTYAMGMGTLLVVAGTFAGLLAHLPKPERWMLVIQRLFGWFMIGLGEYYLIKAGMLWF
jgi:thiol:disulfide interchange protein